MLQFLLLTYVILLFLCAFLSVAKCLLQFTALAMFSLAVVFSPCLLLLSASVLLLCNASFPFHFMNLLCYVCTRFVPVLSSTRICPRVVASTFVPPLLQTNFLSHILLCFNACCWSVIMYLVLIALISSDFCPRRILTLVPQWDYFYHRK